MALLPAGFFRDALRSDESFRRSADEPAFLEEPDEPAPPPPPPPPNGLLAAAGNRLGAAVEGAVDALAAPPPREKSDSVAGAGLDASSSFFAAANAPNSGASFIGVGVASDPNNVGAAAEGVGAAEIVGFAPAASVSRTSLKSVLIFATCAR